MQTYVLRCEMLARKSVAEAFSVFENPYNLARITPPWLDFRVTSPEHVSMRKGAVIDYRFRWFGLPLSWKTLITEYEPPFLFVDEEAKGPYRLWRHRHTFRPTSDGTVVADHVDYALPFGPIGGLANSLFVSDQLQKIFNFRQHALDEIFGGGSLFLREPAIVRK